MRFIRLKDILNIILKDGDYMSWSYDPLWKLLIDRKLKRTDLITQAGINSRTLAKMGKGETVSMDALGRICQLLNCDISAIIKFTKDDP